MYRLICGIALGIELEDSSYWGLRCVDKGSCCSNGVKFVSNLKIFCYDSNGRDIYNKNRIPGKETEK